MVQNAHTQQSGNVSHAVAALSEGGHANGVCEEVAEGRGVQNLLAQYGGFAGARVDLQGATSQHK